MPSFALSLFAAIRSQLARPWLSALLLVLLASLLITLGHEDKRVLQMQALLLPVALLLLWPLPKLGWHRLRSALVWLSVLVFCADGVARAYLMSTYGAAPDSSLVLSAAANTNPRESGEYLQMQWRPMLGWAMALIASAILAWPLASSGARQPWLHRPVWRWMLLVLLLLTTAAYASKPWRRHHPASFWSNWTTSVQNLREEWSHMEQSRQRLLSDAQAMAPQLSSKSRSTVMLVLSDSVNRDNMSLYGYARQTTPQLQAIKKEHGAQLLQVRNAWSVEASTFPALKGMFAVTGRSDSSASQAQHVLALARAAGYKVWWISNHDDMAIQQHHAQLADVVQLINRTPGRVTAGLDGELMDEVQAALQDSAEHKLVVVHMLGAHPHYKLRFPESNHPFEEGDDEVDAGLTRAGRPLWLREFREDYDSAVFYHDRLVADLLRYTQQNNPNDDYRAWMYLSDHGQEVGHESNHAGHSPRTASGFRIPTLMWRNRAATPEQVANAQSQAFRGDWMAWTLADLLHLQWPGMRQDRNFLSSTYQWQAPRLSTEITSFVDR